MRSKAKHRKVTARRSDGSKNKHHPGVRKAAHGSGHQSAARRAGRGRKTRSAKTGRSRSRSSASGSSAPAAAGDGNPGELAQPDWLWNNPTSNPPDFEGASYVSDTDNGNDLLFGGYSTSTSTFSNTVYSHGGGDIWNTLASTGTVPTKREFQAMAYDPYIHKFVMFGGVNTSGVQSDTYTYDDTTGVWAKYGGSTFPAGRWGATMTWDPNIGTHGAVVLLGGDSGVATNAPYLGDMWAFDGTTWSVLSSAVPMGQRAFQQVTFDAHLPLSNPNPPGELVVFGGNKTNSSSCVSGCATTLQSDTWGYDGSWSVFPSTVGGPTARQGYAMAYDSAAQQDVLFGGLTSSGVVNDTWRFDGSQWASVGGIASPGGRAYMQMTYTKVSALGYNVGSMYGGYDGTNTLAQEYQFKHAVATVTVALQNPTTNYAVGQVVGYDITVSDASSSPMSIDDTIATLPSGLSTNPITIVDDQSGHVCTSSTTPSCTVTPGTTSIKFSGTELPAHGSQVFSVYATAAAVKSGAQGFNCQATGLLDTSLTNTDASGSPYVPQVQADSPLAYWRLDDSGTTAQNSGSGGSAYNGTFHGAPPAGVTVGQPGGTGDADSGIALGGSGYMSFGSTPSFGTTGLTIEAWVNPAAINYSSYNSNFAPIVYMSSDTSDSNQIFLGSGLNNDSLVGSIKNTGGNAITVSADGLHPNRWQLVAMTAEPVSGGSSTKVTLYRDGLPIGSTTTTVNIGSVARSFGYLGEDSLKVSGSAGLDPYQGSIDDVAIYPSILSRDRLLAHYQAGSGAAAGSLTATETEPIAETYRLETDADLPSQYNRLDDPVEAPQQEAPAYQPGQTLTVGGGVTVNQPGLLSGDNDTAAVFNGSTGYMTVPTNPTTTSASAVEVWFKTSSTTHGQVLIGAEHTGPTATPSAFVPELWVGANGKLYGEFWNGSVDPLIATNPAAGSSGRYDNGAIYHVVLDSIGTGEYLFVNGVLQAFNNSMVAQNISGPGMLQATLATIGTGYTNTSWPQLTSNSWNYFNGTIDEPEFYSHALTSTQILNHYNVGSGTPTFAQNTAFAPSSTDSQQNTLPAALTICDSGTGNEPWWSFVSKQVGATSTAMVNVADGNLVIPTSDSTAVQAHGRLALAIHRTYNSQDSDLASGPGSFGEGWQLAVGQTDALAGIGVTSTGLQPPSVSSTLNLVTSPQDVTLIDRDGTHHVFTPSGLATPVDLKTATGLLLNVLGLGNLTNLKALFATTASSTVKTILNDTVNGNLCVDQTYNSPSGVHLAMWRYVAVSGTCSAGLATGSLVGYVTERPDRLETIYDATGRTLAMSDGAGAMLKYAYNVDGTPAAVYDATGGSCTVSSSGGASTVSGPCRSITFDYSVAHQTSVTDPAGRVTVYKFTPESFNLLGQTVATPINLLTEVDNPALAGSSTAVSTLKYFYEGQRIHPDDPHDLTTYDCGGSPGQLCFLTDENGHTSSFGYTTPTGVTGVFAYPSVTSITDRRDYNTTFVYSWKNDIGCPNETCVTADVGGSAPKRQTVYAAIDRFGRVGQILSGVPGVTVSTALRNTTFYWDKTASGASCQQPSGKNNNLCEVDRVGSTNPSTSIATPNQKTTYVYDDAGMVESTVRSAGRPSDPASSSNPYTTNVDGSGPSVETIDGYKRIYVYADATPADSHNESVTHNTGSTSPTNPVLNDAQSNASGSHPLLFTLADLTQKAPARAAADANNYSQYLTAYTVDDDPTAAPNVVNATGNCTAGGASTGNSGLICSQTHQFGPVGSGSNATVINRYDANGQLTSRTTPNGNIYTYAYYPNTVNDLSNHTNAGGWLKTVTDPSSEFVVYGYDAAGDTVRTWDRNATDGQSAGSYPGTIAAPGPGAFAQNLYGPGTTTQSITIPWRWQTSSTDPAGDVTTMTNDELGDVTSVTSPNGNTGFASYDEMGNQYRTVDAIQGSNSSNTATFVTYDAFAEPTSVTSPNQAKTNATGGHAVTGPPGSGAIADKPTDAYHVSVETTYDPVGEATTTQTSRGISSAAVPTPAGNCTAHPADTPTFDSNEVVCTTLRYFDTLGNVVASRDATNATADEAYDALGRAYLSITPSNGTTTPTTYTNLDPDGNVVDGCRPNQHDIVGGACGSTSKYATHTIYDLADQPIEIDSYRNATDTTPLRSTRLYDADGNAIETCRPLEYTSVGSGMCDATHSKFATLTTFNSLDRATSVKTYRDGATPVHSYSVYDPSGDVIATVNDGRSTDNAAGTGSGQNYRITGYSYDADHRTVDTVSGLQLATSDPTPDNSTNRTTIANAVGNPGGSYSSAVTSDGTKNDRTRNIYDADSNVVETYDARAFTSSATTPTSADQRDQYRITTLYDKDDRPYDQYTPRAEAGTTTSDPNGDSAQSTQCPQSPTGLPSAEAYPTNTEVCAAGVAYDADGNTVTTSLPASFGTDINATETATYTADDLLQSVMGPDPSNDGHQVQTAAYTYDPDGRTLTSSDANSITNCTIYHLDGSVATQLTAAGSSCSIGTHEEDLSYDADGNVVTDKLANVTVGGSGGSGGSVMNLPTTTTYTADDLTKTVNTPASNGTSGDTDTTRYDYDADGDVTTVTSPDASATDAANQLGRPTITTYTNDDLVAATFTPIIAKTGVTSTWRKLAYQYDPEGETANTATSVVTAISSSPDDPKAAIVANPTTDDGGTQQFTYNPNGRQNTQTGRDNSGSVTETIADSYDAVGDLTSTVDTEPQLDGTIPHYSGTTVPAYSTTVSASYYADGLVRQVDDGNRTTNASYDGAGMITSSSTMTDGGSASTTTYTYDSAELAHSESSPAGGNYSWTYDPGGRETGAVLGNGDTATLNYASNDNNLHLLTISNGGSPVAQDCYAYDEAYRVTQQSDATGSQPSTGCNSGSGLYQYGYYPSGAVHTFVNGSSTATYTYDHDTNRLSGSDVSNNSQTFTYNADNTIDHATFAADGIGNRNYLYDADGRMKTDGCSNYTYDGFDRTASVTADIGGAVSCALDPTVTYQYDGLDRQTGSETTKLLALDQTAKYGYNLLSQNQDSETDSTSLGGYGGLTLYTYDGTGSPLAATRSGNSGISPPPSGTQQLIENGNGSVTDVLGSGGARACEQRFDPFGNSDGDSAATFGASACSNSTTANSISYNSTHTDSATGNQQYGSRTYSATSGVFTTSDSYRGSSSDNDLSVKVDPLTENTYNYVNGDPVNLNDPSGHVPLGCPDNDCIDHADSDPHLTKKQLAYNHALIHYDKTHPAVLDSLIAQANIQAKLDQTRAAQAAAQAAQQRKCGGFWKHAWCDTKHFAPVIGTGILALGTDALAAVTEEIPGVDVVTDTLAVDEDAAEVEAVESALSAAGTAADLTTEVTDLTEAEAASADLADTEEAQAEAAAKKAASRETSESAKSAKSGRTSGSHGSTADEPTEATMDGAGSIARSHEPGGMTSLGRDPDTVNTASWAPKTEGENSVAVHGTPEGWADPVTTDDVVGAMTSHPEFNPEGETCLWSCYAGSNGTGQELANALGQSVRAPIGKVTTYAPSRGLAPFAEGGWTTLFPEVP